MKRAYSAWLRTVTMLIILLLGTALPSSAAEPALKKASLLPLWSPQAQFAGYYTALEKGIYRRHGIDLTIITGGPGRSPTDYLANGKADFVALWLTTAIQQRSSGIRLVNIAQIVQNSSLMLISKKSSGISRPADMSGKKVGLWGGAFAIPPRVFFNRHHLTVRTVPQSYTINLFLRDGIDVTSAMWYNEYHTIINAGINPDELNLFFFKDLGLNLPEDGLYTLEKTVRRDPLLVDSFVRATLEGWEYAFSHPDEALEILIRQMRLARVPANRMHQKWMLDRMRDLVTPRGGRIHGLLTRKAYDETGQILLQEGMIHTLPTYESFARRPDVRR